MGKKKNVRKHATNINNNHNKNEVHIHLGEKKKRAKKRKTTSKPRSDHPQFSSQIPNPLTPQFYVNRSQQFDPMTQSQRETILCQVPVPVPVKTPVQVPVSNETPVQVPVSNETPVQVPAAMKTPPPVPLPIPPPIQKEPIYRNFTSTMPPRALFFDPSPMPPRALFFDPSPSIGLDPTYDSIYEKENHSQHNMYNSDFFKSTPKPDVVIPREHKNEIVYDGDKEESDTESHYPSVASDKGAFTEPTPKNIEKKTRQKVDVSKLTPKELLQRAKKTILNKANNDRAQEAKVAKRFDDRLRDEPKKRGRK